MKYLIYKGLANVLPYMSGFNQGEADNWISDYVNPMSSFVSKWTAPVALLSIGFIYLWSIIPTVDLKEAMDEKNKVFKRFALIISVGAAIVIVLSTIWNIFGIK